MSTRVTLALPSKGALEAPTIEFLKKCGFQVNRPNPRQYSARLKSLPQTVVVFQRVEDIVREVADGTVDLGIVGLDTVLESQGNDLDPIVVLQRDLRYGECDLVCAVPDAWIDVQSISDLAQLAAEYRVRKARDLRIATKYPNLTREYLYSHGFARFELVVSNGGIEAAPQLGHADVVVDLTATGTTLRENHLRVLADGLVLKSQACLIGNLNSMSTSSEALRVAETMLRLVDAILGAESTFMLSAVMTATSEDDLLRHLTNSNVAGDRASLVVTRNVSVAHGNVPGLDSYSVTFVEQRPKLLQTVDHLRKLGAVRTLVLPVSYIFVDSPSSYDILLRRVRRSKAAD